MPNSDKPKPEKEYTYDEVAGFYPHDESLLHYVLVKGQQIVALRLRQDYNPSILKSPAEVWVGDDSPTKEWGDTLANDTVQIPLFVKKAQRNRYTYLGLYEVLTDEATAAQLATARKKVPHDRGVSRIVFLKKT